MLTAIVVGVATLGLALALCQRIFQGYGTIEEDELLAKMESREIRSKALSVQIPKEKNKNSKNSDSSSTPPKSKVKKSIKSASVKTASAKKKFIEKAESEKAGCEKERST